MTDADYENMSAFSCGVDKLDNFFQQIAPCPENIPPKGVCFSDLICIFAMSIVGFSCFLFATLRQINSSTWQNPGPPGQSKNFLLLRRLKSLIYNSVAKLRTYTLS